MARAAISFFDREEADWAAACPERDILKTSGNCSLPDIVHYRLYWNETTRYSRTHRTYTPFFPCVQSLALTPLCNRRRKI